MKRLTDKNTNHVCYDTWELCGLDYECKRDCWKPTPCKIPKIVRKLAEYEDTTLEPSEILSLKVEVERLKETLAETNHNYDLAVEDNEMLRAEMERCHVELAWLKSDTEERKEE